MDLARKEVGTLEWGDGSNPKVVAYFRDAGHPEVKDDETAWCAAFVGAMIRRAGGTPTDALNARSYLKWGTPVSLDEAKPGDVVVFRRGNSTWQGHVAFFMAKDGDKIAVLGGNQRDAVSIARYPAADLLGIRRDAVAPQTRAVQPPSVPAPPAPAEPAQGFWAAILRWLVEGRRKA